MMRRSLLVLSTLALLSTWAVQASSAPNDPEFGKQWGLQKVGGEAAWARSKGQGVKIAIVDSGVDVDHEDLSGRVSSDGYDFIDEDTDPRDENGHGTHVAGIAAATSFNGKGVAGMAPSSTIMSVRVLGGSGFNIKQPDPSSLGEILASSAEGVRWAVDHGAKVINLSLGGVACDPTGSGESCGPGTALASAINYAFSKGALCVVAAGNDDGLESGYSDENALVVVATTSTDSKAGYSNTAGNAKWGISAPGSSVYSTWFTYPIGDHREYDYSSGTSMAAPHVTGAAALLFSMGLSNQQVVDRILQTAKDLGPSGVDRTFGWGRLNAAAAVDIAQQPSGPGSSPSQGKSGRKVTPPGSQASNPAASPGVSPSPNPSPQPEPSSSALAVPPGDDGSSGGGGTSDVPALALTAAALAAGGAGGFYWFKRRTAQQDPH